LEDDMASVAVQSLNLDAFQRYGTFVKMIDNPNRPSGRPVIFTPDMIQMQLGGTSTASFSICRVEPRAPVISGNEYHNLCCEGILPLDGDILIHVAPASSPAMPFPKERIEVFAVPQGTMVVLRPGVWHGAPYAAADAPVNVLVVLPERTYALDCGRVRLSEEEQVEIAV
jgi:ureidoglycolate lyase